MIEFDVKEIAKELISRSRAFYLATIDEEGKPQIRAVENIRCEEKFPHEAKVLKNYDKDFLRVYTTTNTSSKKLKHILRDDNVAIYFCIPEEYKGIMLQGRIELADDLELKKNLWQESWLKYYHKGYTDPDLTILRLKPKYMKAWYKSGIRELQLKG